MVADVRRAKLVRTLLSIRNYLCAYMKPARDGRCDCKFRVSGAPLLPKQENGSGCPEIMSAIEAVMLLTPSQMQKVTALQDGFV
mgnify:CR=1 FL=1